MGVILSYLLMTVLAIRYHIDVRKDEPETILGKFVRNRSMNYYKKHDFFDFNMVTVIAVSLAPITVVVLSFLLISYGIYWVVFEKLLKITFKNPLK